MKINKERISQHKLLKESDDEEEPPECKLLPVLASERSKKQLLLDTNKKFYEIRDRQRRNFEKKYLERKRKLKDTDANFSQSRVTNWTFDNLTPFRGTTEAEGFNFIQRPKEANLKDLDEIMHSNSTLGVSEEN